MYAGLALAFAIIGITAGYLVAASETPVVSAALPVLAGLASAAIAVVAGRADLERIVSYVKDVSKQAKERDPNAEDATLNRLARLAEDHTRSTVRALGLLTSLFALGFAAGLGAGTWVRVGGHVNAWAHPVTGPWTVAKEGEARYMIASFEGALYWLGLEQQLRRAGVPIETIVGLYDQYVIEINAVAATAPEPCSTEAGSCRDELRVPLRTAAHAAVAGGTLASVAPIAPYASGTRVPDPAPAVFMDVLAALQRTMRDGASWQESTLDLTDIVTDIRRGLDDLPRASAFTEAFEALGRRIDTPLCWRPAPVGGAMPPGAIGIVPRLGFSEPNGTTLDIEPRDPVRVPSYEWANPPLDWGGQYLPDFSPDTSWRPSFDDAFNLYLGSHSLVPCDD